MSNTESGFDAVPLTEAEEREAVIARKLLAEDTEEAVDADTFYDTAINQYRQNSDSRSNVPKAGTAGFTLLELLIVITIIFILAGLVTSALYVGGGGRDKFLLFHPQAAHAEAEQRQADEMKRANDLKERELRLRELK